MTEKTKTGERLFTVLIFAAATVFLFWKCRFGFASADESFYLTIPDRLLAGDALFFDEWHLSQTSSVLLVPLVAFYHCFHTGPEGILLFFRCVFTVLHSLTAFFVYYRLKRFDRRGALMAAVGFQLYAPFGIMALSYNSMGLIAMVLCTTVFATAESRKGIQYFISGILLACAVLCCPFLVILYMVFTAAAIACRRKTVFSVSISRSWAPVTLGAAACAVSFCLTVLARASFSQIFRSIGYIFNDPEHKVQSIYTICRTYIVNILKFNGKWSLLCLSLYAVLMLSALIDRRKRIGSILFLAAALVTLLFEASILKRRAYINFIMFPLNLFALFCRIRSNNEQVKRLFAYGWIPGMIYSFCIHCGSNQAFYVISSASAAAFLSSVIIIILTGRDLRATDGRGLAKLCIPVIVCVMLFQLGSESFLRYGFVFREGSMSAQTNELPYGPQKGLLVTEEKQQLYESYYHSLEEIPEYAAADSVAFLSKKTWLYLIDDKKCGSYSAWLSGVNSDSVQRLLAYYEINPKKIPQLILLENEYEQYSGLLCDSLGLSAYKTPLWTVIR